MFKRMLSKKRHVLGLEITDYLFVSAGLVVFALVAFWNITKSSIWFDEAFGAYMIKFNFAEIARYTAADVHPPLYYWLLKLWSMLFGDTELALRSMSVLFGGVAIIFGYLLIRRLFNKTLARVSLLFMVVSPMLIRYSQEARMYTLVAAIALAATYTLTFAINSKKRLPWVIYGILVGLGMWVHYFSAIVWIAHWVWRAGIIRRDASKGKFIKEFFSKEWVMAHIVAIVVFLPWLPFFIHQFLIVQTGFWIPPATPNTIINFMTNAVYYLNVNEATGWLAFGIIAVIVSITVVAFRIYKSQNNEQRQAYSLIMALAFVPMILLFLLSMPPLRPVFVDRYLVPSTLGIALFIGITLVFGVKHIGTKWRIVAIVVIAGMMTIGITNVWRLGNYNKNTNTSNNTRQIIEAVDDKASNGQPIIAATPWLFYEAVFYSTSEHQVYFVELSEYKYGSLAMLKYNDQHKIKDINAFTKSNPIVWYVGYIGEGDISAPNSNWKPVQELVINDSISNKPAYKAIQYKIAE